MVLHIYIPYTKTCSVLPPSSKTTIHKVLIDPVSHIDMTKIDSEGFSEGFYDIIRRKGDFRIFS